MPESPRSRWFKIVAVLIGLGLALALDFVLRQIYLKVLKKPFLDVHSLRQKDENFHHGIKPNSEGLDIYGPNSAKHFSNSLGLRDEKNQGSLPGGRSFTDSFHWGFIHRGGLFPGTRLFSVG